MTQRYDRPKVAIVDSGNLAQRIARVQVERAGCVPVVYASAREALQDLPTARYHLLATADLEPITSRGQSAIQVINGAFGPENFPTIALARSDAQAREVLGTQRPWKAIVKPYRGNVIGEAVGQIFAVLPPRGYGSFQDYSSDQDPSRVVAGRYVLMGHLGEGGFGQVYKAFDALELRVVALKAFKPEAPLSEQRFEQEARVLERLDHPNVLSLYGSSRISGVNVLALEYHEGETIKSIVTRNGPVQRAKVIHIGAELADALEYLAREDVIHRDLKPENVLITRLGKPVLLDFGIAKDPISPELTQQLGGQVGTYMFASPELIRGDKVTSASDVYALGMVLAYMRLGENPINVKGSSYPEVLTRLMRRKEPLLVNPEGDTLGELVNRMTDPDAQGRPHPSRVRGDLAKLSRAQTGQWIRMMADDETKRIASSSVFRSILEDTRADLERRRRAEELEEATRRFLVRDLVGV